MKHKWLVNAIAVLFLITGLFSSFGTPQVSLAAKAESNSADKIEGALLDKFSAEGTADFIIRFTAQADLSSAYSMAKLERREFVYQSLLQTAERSQASAKGILDVAGFKYETLFAGNDLYVWKGDLATANAIAALPEVSFIRATRVYQVDPVTIENPLVSAKWAGDLLSNNLVFSAGNAPDATTDWGITDTKADQFWTAFGVKGDGIVVANIDTGVQWDHPALVDAFKCPGDPTNPACWDDPSNICGSGGACDNAGHGTHTMGTMVAKDDPGLPYIAGMAPNAQWIACKGCESSSCSEFALTSCADWILAPGGSSANAPDVVNNSWGGTPDGDPWYLSYVNAWRAAGIFPAFSAGNAGPTCDSMGDPGSYQESFASAAHDSGRNIASFSSRGPSAFGDDPYTKPNISAPGVSICSTVPTNGWNCGYSGTSMASPHTAGAVALLWSCNPDLVGQIDVTFQALQNAADTPPDGNCGAPPGGEGNYTFGYGYLNALQLGIDNCGGVEIGTIDGYVKDTGGNPIEGATVTANPAAEGAGTQAVTDPTGYYTMDLVVGFYDVTASKLNYTPQTQPGIQVISGTTTTLPDFVLSFLGAWTQWPALPAPCPDWTRFDGEFYDGLVYFMGGRSGTLTDGTIYSLDATAQTCTSTGTSMPVPISNYTIVPLNDGSKDILCTFGGRDNAGGYSNAVQCYDPVANTISQPTTLPVELAAFIPGGAAGINNKAYVFGGFRNTSTPYETAATFEWDPVTNVWTQKGDLTVGLGYIQVAVADGKIWGFGGTIYDGTNLNAQTIAQVFDPVAGTWDDASVADLPTAGAEGRGYGFDTTSAYELAGNIIVAGGGLWPADTYEVYSYNIATNIYDYSFPDLNITRRDQAGVFIPGDPGNMWVFGGRSSATGYGGDNPPYGPPESYDVMLKGPADINIPPVTLAQTLFPDTIATMDFTIQNVGGEDLTWALTEVPALGNKSSVIPSQGANTPTKSRTVALSLDANDAQSTTAAAPAPDATVSLVLDDGSRDNDIGIGGTWEFIWANRFTPAPSEFPFQLNEIQVYFSSVGMVNVGDNIILAVYENTTGSFDPAPGSNLLATFPATVQAVDAWNVYTLATPVNLFGPGDVIIGVIGLEVPGTSYWPASIDQTTTQQRSWAGWWTVSPPPDPPVLPPDDTWILIDTYFPGNWMVRGYGETPEVPWLSEIPTSGVLGAGASQTVQVTWDSAGMTPGQYFASLDIASNDLDEPVVTLPVTMTVIAMVSGVELGPDASLSGDPGVVVNYTVAITNTGNHEDTFDLSAAAIWNTVLPASITLAAGEASSFNVQVTIPADALAGAFDNATITAESQTDPAATDEAVLTTVANQVYGATLEPALQGVYGDPGVTVGYTLTLTNIGNGDDTFALAYTGLWTATLPASIDLAAGESQDFLVEVTIPADALADDVDNGAVSATSLGGGVVTADVKTVANAVYGVELTPATDGKTDVPGTSVVYVLHLTNTGNVSDTIVLTYTAMWDTSLSGMSFDLAVGESVDVTVTVLIPADAANGELDVATITATSTGDATKTAQSVLTTTAFVEGPTNLFTYLPVVFKSYTAP